MKLVKAATLALLLLGISASSESLDHLHELNIETADVGSNFDCYRNDSSCSGVYQFGSGETAFRAICIQKHHIAGDGWLVIYQRIDGSESFNRNWLDYKEGFGHFRGNFWLGLERIHRITASASYELFVEKVERYEMYRYSKYSKFVIGSELENYAIKELGKHELSNDYVLGSLEGTLFSTFDRDNDGYADKNIAVDQGAAWWFGSPNSNNLNVWNELWQPFSRMMLRKVSDEQPPLK